MSFGRCAGLPAATAFAGLVSFSLLPHGPAARAQGTPAVPSLAQPASPLAGYVVEVSGTSARLSLTAADGVRPGDAFSALQYGEEIARLRIRTVMARESIADLLSLKPGVILRRLDTVIPSTAVLHPAGDLQPPPASNGAPLQPRGPRRHRPADDGDIVSRADWAYPALSTLAEKGLLPHTAVREFHGDQELTHDEIRELVAEAAANLDQMSVSEGTRRLLYHLARDYGVGTDMADPKRGFALSHVSRDRLATGDEPTFSSSSTYQGFAHLGRDEYAVVSVSKARREWYGDHGYPWLNEAFVRARWLGFDWEVGQRSLRWGPGYTGSLVLDDVGPPFPVVRAQRGWPLGRLGYWKLDEFGGRYVESGAARYLMGRRFAHPIGRKLELGIGETMKTVKTPNPTVLVLPFLAYQRIYQHNRGTNVDNVQEDLDLRYRSGDQEVYGELFIDDITAPSVFGRSQGKVPRRIGYLVGWRRARLFGARGPDLRVEYAATDRETYLHRNPTISLTDRGVPLGHPMGPNAQSFMVRADHRISSRVELTGAIQILSSKTSGPPTVAKGTAVTLAAAYDFRRDRSLTLKLSPGRRVDRYDPNTSGSAELIADWSF